MSRNSYDNTNYYNIDICEIKDGNGLTVEINNNGEIDVKNINLYVDIKEGKLIKLSHNRYDIPLISVGESKFIDIEIFGLGLGIFFKNPVISLSITSSGIEITSKKIEVRVFGKHVKIIDDNIGYEDVSEGYIVFSPEYSRYTFILNNNGRILHFWKSNYIQSFGTYLTEDGILYRLDLPFDNTEFFGGGVAGRVETFDEDSNILWEFEYSNEDHCSHHDIEVLPNGNVLMIAWESKTRNEAIAAGRDPNKIQGDALWPDHIIEVEPTGPSGGDIIWEWHLWDHLVQDYDSTKDNYGVVADHPELVDINYGNSNRDWTHTNSVDYNEEFDQILLSIHNLNEIWIIDHSTTTEDAAGHTGGRYGKGGDLLYRWGNPQVYRAGGTEDQKYFGQHDASWVEEGCPGEGNILVFNNGGNGRRYSSVDEIVPPVDSNGNYSYTPGEAYEPTTQTWIYTTETPSDMFSSTVSSAQRLSNGNTLICSGNQGWFLEVTAEKEIVWQYHNILPNSFTNVVAKIHKYPTDYPGFPEIVSSNQKETSLYEFFSNLRQ